MRTLIEGWRLLGLVAVMLLVMAAAGLAVSPDLVDGLRRIIRWTARSSLLLFLMVFLASAGARLAPGSLTRWQLRNRRQLGLSFAVSHGIHLAAILCLAARDQALFWQLTNIGTIISGGLAYVFILAMALTSFDRTRTMLGQRAWTVLHVSGAWYLWMSFVFTFGKRAVMDVAYLPAMLLIFVALVIRLLAWWVRRPVDVALRG